MTAEPEARVTEGPWELPEGWKYAKLGEIARISSGGTPKRSRSDYYGGDLAWVKISDLQNMYVDNTEETITDLGLTESSAKLFPKGTILFSVFATIGKVGVLDIEATTNQAIAGIQLETENVDPEYLAYFLSQAGKKFASEGRGMAQNNVNLTMLRSLPVLLPPLSEQRSIVACVEELLAEVQEARALLAEMRRDTDRMMDAALDEFIDDLDAEFTDSPTIDQLLADERVKLTGGGTPSKGKAEYWNGPIPWISPKDMKSWRIGDAENHISSSAVEETSAKLISDGSVLVVIRGMILAHTWPVAVNTAEAVINQDMKAITPTKTILPEYLSYILRAREPQILRQVEVAAHGTRRLKTDRLKEIRVPDLPVPDQASVVKHLDSVQAEVDGMREALDEKERLLDRLERSVLERAFRGEL